MGRPWLVIIGDDCNEKIKIRGSLDKLAPIKINLALTYFLPVNNTRPACCATASTRTGSATTLSRNSETRGIVSEYRHHAIVDIIIIHGIGVTTIAAVTAVATITT